MIRIGRVIVNGNDSSGFAIFTSRIMKGGCLGMNDKDDKVLNIFKWVCIIGGGILTFIGSTILSGIQRDRKYEKTLGEKIREKLEQS